MIFRFGAAILAAAIAEEMLSDESQPHVPHEDVRETNLPGKEVAADIGSVHTLTLVNDAGEPLTIVNDQGWPLYFTADRALLELSVRYDGESYKIVS
jgi:hypothetical protein